MSVPKADNQSSLTQWAYQAIGQDTVQAKVRLRGNDLHILYEDQESPEQATTVTRLVQALQVTNLDALLSPSQPRIYHVFVSGRAKGQKLPTWSKRIYLNQLERHLEEFNQSSPPEPEPQMPTDGSTVVPSDNTVEQQPSMSSTSSTSTGGALIVSNRSLAQQGQPEAIARYLSETLSRLGVGVKVIAKTLPYDEAYTRLWIFCESAYSPDPSLLAEPVAQQLRDLKLTGFRDAVICSQVTGEKKPDWLLRVDLTPPEAMLKEWARWGDIQALTRLLNQALLQQNIEVQAVLKEATLHLLCRLTGPVRTLLISVPPEKQLCVETIAPVLENLAPQGIHAATLYGQIGQQETPAWVDWLNLPAALHRALGESTLELAQQGDEPAITFLLSRLLNPDLDGRLATGGVRVVIRRKADLLHVMSDGPVCPPKSQVGPAVAKLLRQLKIPDITGVRVYGRRAGQKQPAWSYGVDFKVRKRLVPEPTPEFAASHVYLRELFSQPQEEILRPDLTQEYVQGTLAQVGHKWMMAAKALLLQSQLFLERVDILPSNSVPDKASYQVVKVALVWGTLGLLLTLQADWILGRIVTRSTPTSTADSLITTNQTSNSSQPSSLTLKPQPFTFSTHQSGKPQPETGFNHSSFTHQEESRVILDSTLPKSTKPLVAAPLKEKATATAIILAARSQRPSFNSRQLDEQLALYQYRVTQSGVPDVLIIGSSRALRGIDPAALSQALKAQGYPNVQVFNFGVNGATAQVVDLIVRQLLTPEQLPKLILWADGARAFNSGREDITYNGVVASLGYRQLVAKGLNGNVAKTDSGQALASLKTNESLPTLPDSSSFVEPKSLEHQSLTLTASYESVNQWLNQTLAAFSATYSERNQLKTLLNQQLQSFPLVGTADVPPLPNFGKTSSPVDEPLDAVDFDGFLPLSARFNPASYYRNHPKVSGENDGDYESFQLAGKQDVAIQKLTQFTKIHQISLVFVNTPLTEDYLDSARLQYEQEFEQYMMRLAAQRGFIFRNLSQLWPTQYDYFSDPSHLNRYGAYEVANKLAQDPLISWPSKSH